jgi:hypothetical protein
MVCDDDDDMLCVNYCCCLYTPYLQPKFIKDTWMTENASGAHSKGRSEEYLKACRRQL